MKIFGFLFAMLSPLPTLCLIKPMISGTPKAMKPSLALLCLLALTSPLRADDDQMSNWLVGKWITSFNQPLYQGGSAKIAITAIYSSNGQYEMYEIMAFSAGGGARQHANGTWDISNGILTTSGNSLKFDDGDSVQIDFSGPDRYRFHGVDWVRSR
jgi:hypothetical protein